MTTVLGRFVRATALSAAATLGLAVAASAATVNFGPTDWTNQDGNSVGTDWNFSISDISGGVNVAVSLTSGSTDTGDILLVGLEGVNLTGSAFGNTVSSTGDGITDLCLNANTCGGGGGFNGGIFAGQNPFVFDAAVRIGDQGSSNGLNTSVSFDIIGSGFSAGDFTAVGLRLQSVGSAPSGGGGSLQLINTTITTGTPPPPPPPSPVPLPAGIWLMLAGLGGLGAVRLRRRQLT